jgi:MOSC domain-containing protein YiiM
LQPNSGSPLAALLAGPMRPGRVVWIGVRPARRRDVVPVERVTAEADKGLQGDHYRPRSSAKRGVTLVQAEHLEAIAAFLQTDGIDPALLRRNVVVEGINLLALKDKRIRIGTAILEFTGECHPCSRMEETLGPGGYNAMRGHGGITARIVDGGEIGVGDSVSVDSSPKLDFSQRT